MIAKIRTLGQQGARDHARALLRRAPNLRCSVCEHHDFAMLEDPEAGVRSHLTRSSDRFTVQQDATTLVCTHCGHVMQFADAFFKLGRQPEEFGQPVENE